MKIIFGLGNPGKEYVDTRHNIGFFFMDKLREKYNLPDFEMNKKFNAEISKSDELLLVKPTTFMNLSGVAVKNILTFYKLTPDDILVIHDDLDIACGKYKIATDSSSAGHNGVQNIIDTLGTQKFKRVRIGIGAETSIEDSTEDSKKCPPRLAETACRREAGRLGAHDYVLDKFTEDEIKKIYPALLQIIETELPKLITVAS